jgi:hypothetical protein
MKLFIAGVNHFDLFGRKKLRGCLKELSVINHTKPTFMAVEYDKNHFVRINEQRKLFRNLVKNEWRFLTEEQLDIFELSLAYEGDSHIDFYPEVEILWLDKDRQTDRINMFAEDRFKAYKAFCLSQNITLTNDNLLQFLSCQAYKNVETSGNGNYRDVKFKELICNKINEKSQGWSLIIVGSNHTQNKSGFMRELIENGGQKCEVILLDRTIE